MLKISFYVEKEYLFVRLSGVLVNETALIFDNELLDLIQNIKINNLKIDLLDLEYIDEVGYEQLMLLLQKIKKCWQVRKI